MRGLRSHIEVGKQWLMKAKNDIKVGHGYWQYSMEESLPMSRYSTYICICYSTYICIGKQHVFVYDIQHIFVFVINIYLYFLFDI